MPALLVQLRTRADKLRAEQRETLRQLVIGFPDLPERAAGEIIAAIDRNTAAENGWPFVMMSAEDNARVVAWLTERSAQPMRAVLLWSKLFLNLRRDTGEIMQSREELAEAIRAPVQDVSRLMTELETIGAVARKRVKVAGMRGPGMVRYFMSPRIATHLANKAREEAQAAAPPLLRLVEPPVG